ncbi:MAG: DUF58 domain-containing protein [Leptospiraceae bacterium]|nr:DUF58 domain-containing protein [Leptospiraceae bacterium]
MADDLQLLYSYSKNFSLTFDPSSASSQHGRQTSRKRGYDNDLFNHKPYSTGDDLRRLDWRLYARTERMFVREGNATANLQLEIIFDISDSMQCSAETWRTSTLLFFLIALILKKSPNRVEMHLCDISPDFLLSQLPVFSLPYLPNDTIFSLSENSDWLNHLKNTSSKKSLEILLNKRNSNAVSYLVISDFRLSIKDFERLLLDFSPFAQKSLLIFVENSPNLGNRASFIVDAERDDQIYWPANNDLTFLENQSLRERVGSALNMGYKVKIFRSAQNIIEFLREW